jgi:hypothetical protein
MISIKDFSRTKLTLTKNLVTDQTFRNLVTKVNTPVFDVTLGLGISTATSIVAMTTMGGFSDQSISAVMRYVSPTAQGAENFGVILRVKCVETGDTASTDYYYARCQAGVARITRVVANVFTTLSSQAFVLPQSTDVTITFSVVGSALSATFDAGGSPATVSLSSTDTQISGGGLLGFRSTSQTVFCKSFTAQEL